MTGAALPQTELSAMHEDEPAAVAVPARPVIAAKARRLYLPQLDTLRFFAFLSVFFYHGLPSNDVSSHSGHARTVALLESIVRRSGANGVALFFVLSAFLITELLKREKEFSGTIDLKKFYVRRTLRIWPLYFLMVAIGLMVQPLSPGFRMSVTEIVSFLLFWRNWDLALHGFSWNPISVLWTVSAEEQFYLVWPLLQRILNRRTMIAVCVSLLVLFPLLGFLPVTGRPASVVRVALYFMFFPAGGLLSLLPRKSDVLGMGRCLALLAAGAGLWALGTWVGVLDGDHEAPLRLLVLGDEVTLLGTVLIFLAFLRSDPNWSSGGLRYLGKISYGLYVFQIFGMLAASRVTDWMGLLTSGHHSLKDLAIGFGVRLPLGLGLTIGMASLSYRFIETPFLNLKDRFTVVRSRSV
jgi:peptidoglycan/LPS O-acetylase OafA/YrhL